MKAVWPDKSLDRARPVVPLHRRIQEPFCHIECRKTSCNQGGLRSKPWQNTAAVVLAGKYASSFNSDLNRLNALCRGVPAAQARVIHSGIDIKKFGFKPGQQFQQPLKILVPGRIEKRKGQKDAVEVLRQLLNSGIEARITLAGPNWTDGYSGEIITEAQDPQLAGKVTILPMQSTDEMVALYHDADICIFSSDFRTGFSRVPLEAMATGCLMISYGNEGSDEIIEDGRNGYLVPTGDYQRIIEIIKSYLGDPERVQTMVNTARQLVEQQYSMDIYVDQIEQFLHSAARH